MNGLKNLLATCINFVAAAYFAFAGLVIWSDALVMTAGAVAGGVGGATIARRIGRAAVRRIRSRDRIHHGAIADAATLRT